MNIYNDPAGGTFLIRCKKCNQIITMYHRSFYGTGKKCPGCGFIHRPTIKGMIATYEIL